MANSIHQLYVEQELALLRADLAVSMPENYSMEEMRQISEDLDAKTAALDEALREDFNAMPLEMQAMMCELFKMMGSDGAIIELRLL